MRVKHKWQRCADGLIRIGQTLLVLSDEKEADAICCALDAAYQSGRAARQDEIRNFLTGALREDDL